MFSPLFASLIRKDGGIGPLDVLATLATLVPTPASDMDIKFGRKISKGCFAFQHLSCINSIS